jgi:hypothetical protein
MWEFDINQALEIPTSPSKLVKRKENVELGPLIAPKSREGKKPRIELTNKKIQRGKKHLGPSPSENWLSPSENLNLLYPSRRSLRDIHRQSK